MQAEIWVWIVCGNQTETLCLSEEGAKQANSGLGGWGDIKKEKRLAELVEGEEKK